MTAFEYEALDDGGRTRRGVVSADSARLARQELRRKHLTPVKLAPASTKPALSFSLPGTSTGLPQRDLVVTTRQLATMVDAAAPVEEALNTIAAQAERPQIRKTLLAVRSGVVEGQKLSDALAKFPETFSPLYRALVAAGESSGTLPAVLDRLAGHLEKAHRLKSKVRSAMIYPAALALTAAVVVAGLMAFVVPKVVEQFETIGQDLPALTRVVIAISTGLQSYGLVLLILGVGLVWGAKRLLGNPAVRLRFDRAVLRLPFLGRLVRNLQSARLARTLATLVGSGVPVLDGLSAARATISNTVVAAALKQVAGLVQEGASLSHALRQAQVFSPMVIYMVATGERSGNLDTMLEKSADHLEQEFEDVTDTALSLLEPAIIIVMGAIVATIVFAILMPILQLNTLALL